MDLPVGVMPILGDQPPEGVLHGAGGGGVAVRLDCRQVDNVPADEYLGHKYFVEDVVHRQHLRLGLIRRPIHVRKGLKLNAIFFKHRQPFVVVGAFPGMGDDGLILHRDEVFISFSP